MQNCSNSTTNALEFLQSRTHLLKYSRIDETGFYTGTAPTKPTM